MSGVSDDAGPATGLDAYPNLDLNKLRTFFVIAQAGGVSAAARRLSLSRSAVSHSLALLEESLGVPLFHRVAKRLVLTRDGARLRAAFADVQARLDDAVSTIGEQSGDVEGTVRLGLFHGFSRHLLGEAIGCFLDEHPHARVRLSYAARAELADQLATGRLDFTLSLHGRAEARQPQLKAMRLFEQPLVLAARDRPPRGRSGFARIAELPIIDYFRAEPLIDRWAEHHFGRQRVPRSNVRVWAQSTDLVLELCRRGVGAGVLPLDLVEPYRRRQELRVIRGPRPVLRDEIWLNELPGSKRDRLQRAFRSVLLALPAALREGPLKRQPEKQRDWRPTR
jgi:DNA-binding transcriptional LysR family regulator